MNLPSLLQLLRTYGKPFLELSALILGAINGLMLLKFYARDRAKLTVHPIHPNTYQWWFNLPPREYEGKPTRRYGFISYIAVQNSGLRKTQLTSWGLSLKTRLGKRCELHPMSMPEPSAEIGEHVKLYPVLGQRSLHLEGDTLVDSGCSTSGMVYCLYECYGGAGWDPSIINNRIDAVFHASDGFNHKARCNVQFRQKALEEIKKFAPGIERMDDKTPGAPGSRPSLDANPGA